VTEILARGAEIRDRITELAADVAAGSPDPVVVGVLKGSVVFLADLLRRLPGQPVLDFLAISPYQPGTGRVRLVKDLDTDISGRRVVLVEDIVDTGLKLGFLLRELERRRPARLEVCTLLYVDRLYPATR
jgi:hypoxanthine phosphoribosyltransferase